MTIFMKRDEHFVAPGIHQIPSLKFTGFGSGGGWESVRLNGERIHPEIVESGKSNGFSYSVTYQIELKDGDVLIVKHGDDIGGDRQWVTTYTCQ